MTTSVAAQIGRLRTLTLEQLCAEYQKAFGKPTQSRNRKQLFARIARKLQAEGKDAPGSARQPTPPPSLIARYDRGKPSPATRKTPASARRRDPRLPKAGTTLERIYKGEKLLVRVLEQGFEYEGKPFRSLSAVAQAVTGAKAINGYLFFLLGDYAKREKDGK